MLTARTRALAYSRKAEINTADRDGFTLLELLVVMAILAGLVAIALPQFNNLFSRVQASFQRTDIEQQLLQLPQQVRESGRSGVLADPAEKGGPANAVGNSLARSDGALERVQRLQITLPAGWTMHIPKPLFYHFTGACTGGEIDFSVPPQSFRYVLAAPLCRPQLADTHAPS